MSNLQSQASLVVAASDLKVVQLLRRAMAAADCAAGRLGPCGTLIARERRILQPEPKLRQHPRPRIEPRVVYHPTPRFEIRPVHRKVVEVPEIDNCSIRAGQEDRCPLPPPWRMPVWKNSIQPAPVIKVSIHRTDVHNKGSLIDFFL